MSKPSDWPRTLFGTAQRVYPIVRRDVEILFWIAVLFSNSLGTAFGDFLVTNIGLTFIQGALVTAGVILVVAALHYFTRLNDVLLFWIAFIFTRPFGATFGDLLTKPLAAGGLNLPREYASLNSAWYRSVRVHTAHREEQAA